MKLVPILRAGITLRKVSARLSRLRGTAAPVLDLSGVRQELGSMLEKVTVRTAAKAEPALMSYVDNNLADWLARVKVHHETVAAELDALALRVVEAKELYEIYCEDQTSALDDLEAAVAHALERVCDPDAPYFEPEPRNKRRGGNG